MRHLLLFIIMTLSLCISCTNDTLPEEFFKDIEFDKKEFDAERLAWERLNITSYQFVQDLSTLGPLPVIKIDVINGKRTDYEIIKNRAVYYGAIIFADTINDLFDAIISDVEYDTEQIKSDSDGKHLKKISVVVTYDEEYHFPKTVSYQRTHSWKIPGYNNNYKVNITDFAKF